LAKVKDIMQTNVDKVNVSTTVLEASKIMNDSGSSGAVVFNGDKVVGMLTDRRLLRKFVPLDKRPDEVTVKDVMSPFFKIDANASIKEAKRRLLEGAGTRLGVFEGDKFLGWVSLADIDRRSRWRRRPLISALLSDESGEPMEVLCPNCRSGFLEKLESKGEVIRYQCPNCGYSL